MAVLVVGGSGFIGSEVTTVLVKNRIDTISRDLIQPNIVDGKQMDTSGHLEISIYRKDPLRL